jgi:hypothetical protein
LRALTGCTPLCRDGDFVGGLLEADMKKQCMGVAGLGAVNLQWFLTWHFDAVEITGPCDETPARGSPRSRTACPTRRAARTDAAPG